MEECNKCEKINTFQECFICKNSICKECGTLYNCDFCLKSICKKCSEISPTEERCMTLRNRLLKLHCQDCKCVINYQQLLEANKKLEAENTNLKRQLDTTLKDLTGKNIQFQDTQKNFYDTLKEKLTVHIKNTVSSEISQLREELNNLKLSNIDLIRLITEAPSNITNTTTPSHRDIAVYQRGYNNTLNKHPVQNTKPISVRTNQTKKSSINKTPQKIAIEEKHEEPNKIQLANKKILTDLPQPDKNITPQKIEATDQVNKNSDEPFTEVRNKHRKRKIVGTAENSTVDGSNDFEGSQISNNSNKKIWLFISRIKSHVNEEKVNDYISKKAKVDKDLISVKKLKTWYQTENNNCFLIGLDPNLKETVYDPKFWPKGVAFERFNFKQGQRFLDKPKSQPNVVNGGNFL